MDEEVVQQMGLLLTQVRVTRLSLESIERSTSRFAGLALLASSATTPFGAPPLLDGALKVYVVNTDDFVAPAGGGFLETIFGGIGRFLGGLVGGIVGGVIGGVQIGSVLNSLARIVTSLENTVRLLVNTLGLSPGEWRQLLGLNAAGTERVTPPPSTPNPIVSALAGLLDRIPTEQLITIIGLFTHMVDALVLLAPLATGAVAALLSTVGDLRLEIINWISFAMRNLLLLRSVAIAVLADTASLIAPLAATIIGSIAGLVGVVLTGVTGLLADAVQATFGTTARILARGLTASVNTAIDFLVGTVLPLLNYVQQTPLVRLLAWFVTALPAMMTALAAAAGSPLSSSQSSTLLSLSTSGAAFLTAATPGAPSTTDLDASRVLTALDPAAESAIRAEITSLGESARTSTTAILTEARDAVTATAAELRATAARANATFGAVLDEHLRGARGQIEQFDRVMATAEAAARRRPETMLDRIAASYRSWLTGGGMDLLLGEITRHFAATPAEAGGRTIPGRVLQGFVDAEGRHDVIVEVGEVVIDVTAPVAGASATVVGPGPDVSLAGLERRARARGGTVDDLLPVGAQ